VNAFLEFAENNATPREKVQAAKADRRAAKRAEVLATKAKETSTCLKEWTRWRQEQIAAALKGPHSSAIAGLLDQLKSAEHWDNGPLASDFLHLDRDTAFLARRLVNARIAELREKSGLAPFDDGLEGL
jgi:hypothetical protein